MDQLNVRGATGNRAFRALHFLGTVLGIGMFL